MSDRTEERGKDENYPVMQPDICNHDRKIVLPHPFLRTSNLWRLALNTPAATT